MDKLLDMFDNPSDVAEAAVAQAIAGTIPKLVDRLPDKFNFRIKKKDGDEPVDTGAVDITASELIKAGIVGGIAAIVVKHIRNNEKAGRATLIAAEFQAVLFSEGLTFEDYYSNPPMVQADGKTIMAREVVTMSVEEQLDKIEFWKSGREEDVNNVIQLTAAALIQKYGSVKDASDEIEKQAGVFPDEIYEITDQLYRDQKKPLSKKKTSSGNKGVNPRTMS